MADRKFDDASVLDFADNLQNRIDQLERKITQLFARLLPIYTHPNEGFFQTLIGNSEYATTLERDNRRYIKGFYSEDNVFFGAMDLTAADVQSMMQGNALFARKFDSDKDATVLDILERML
ncbi:hypothetical protein D3C74_67700 [compost metagenome]